LIHHQKLHNIRSKELPQKIRDQRREYLAECDEETQAEFKETPDEDSTKNIRIKQKQQTMRLMSTDSLS
jgi:hypothetical protein